MRDELYGVGSNSFAVDMFDTRVAKPAVALAIAGYRVRVAVGNGCPIDPAWFLLEKRILHSGPYTVKESSFGFNGVPELDERSLRGWSPFHGRICVVAHDPWTNCEPRVQYAMTFDATEFGYLMAERKAELEADDAEGGE